MAKLINTDNFNGQVRICDDVANEYKRIAIDHIHHYFASQEKINRSPENLVFALSGGSSGRICMEALCSSKDQLLHRVEWLLVDERCVEKTHPDSNYNLLSSIIRQHGLEETNIHDLNCNNASTYESILLSKNLEIIQLGFGPDGHCASLFPNSEALRAASDELILTNSDPSGLNPYPRITMTLPAIEKFNLIIICVIGEEKKDAIHAISEGKILPASMIKTDNIIWLIDKKAI